MYTDLGHGDWYAKLEKGGKHENVKLKGCSYYNMDLLDMSKNELKLLGSV